MSKLESLQAAWRDAECPPEGEAVAVRLIPALEARVRELEAVYEAAIALSLAPHYAREGAYEHLVDVLAAASAETKEDA